MGEPLRALVIGRGSMGKRRIRDLTALGVGVESWDITDGDEKRGGELMGGADAVVVSTPPMTKDYAGIADSLGIPAFTEADVEVIEGEHFPSCTPLFTDWYGNISEHARSFVAYTLHVGQHIDDWHPGADPATYYAYKDETSPTREMIPFELIWLTKLFGPVQEAKGIREPDAAQVVILHSGGALGHIFIDARSRPPIRRFTGVGNGYRKSWDLEYTEATYLREMRAFVETVEGGKPWPYSLAEERANLEVLHTIERIG